MSLPIKRNSLFDNKTYWHGVMTFNEKRSHYRMKINVPVFIQGTDTTGKIFFDLSHTYNVSAIGASLSCHHSVKLYDNLILSIPAPLDVKSNKINENEFQLKAQITRIEKDSLGDSENKVCVRFDRPLYE